MVQGGLKIFHFSFSKLTSSLNVKVLYWRPLTRGLDIRQLFKTCCIPNIWVILHPSNTPVPVLKSIPVKSLVLVYNEEGNVNLDVEKLTPFSLHSKTKEPSPNSMHMLCLHLSFSFTLRGIGTVRFPINILLKSKC